MLKVRLLQEDLSTLEVKHMVKCFPEDGAGWALEGWFDFSAGWAVAVALLLFCCAASGLGQRAGCEGALFVFPCASQLVRCCAVTLVAMIPPRVRMQLAGLQCSFCLMCCSCAVSMEKQNTFVKLFKSS